MQEFLYKAGISTLLLLGYMGIMTLINKSLYRHEISRLPVASTIIVGNSSMDKLHDIFFSETHNISSLGESSKSTYVKLEDYLRENPKAVKNVVLSYSWANIGSRATKIIDSMYIDLVRVHTYFSLEGFVQKKKRNSAKLALRYYLSFQHEYFLDLLGVKNIRNNPVYVGRHKDLDIEEKDIIDEESPYVETWRKGERKYHVKLHARINRIFGTDDPAIISEIAIDYLYRTVELCKRYNVQLYLVDMPKTKPYRDLVPANVKNKHSDIAQSLSKSKNVTYLDFSKYFDDNIRHFSDQDHITHYGGKLIAAEIVKTIGNN